MFTLFSLFINSAFAQDTGVGGGDSDADTGTTIKIESPLQGIETIDQFIDKILDAVQPVVLIFLTLAFIWTGFKFVVARGNPEKLTDARRALWYTVIGALIILAAKLFVEIIKGTISALQ